MTNDRYRRLQGAILDQRAGRLAEAEQAYKRLLRKSPNDFECAYLLAMLHAQQGNLKAAIELFRRAAAINPNSLDAHYNLAVALTMAGSHADAARAYKRALEIEPRHAGARNNYASTLLHLGDAEGALHQYDELIRFNPNHADAHNNRGMALEKARRFADAVNDYDRAIALRPDFAEAHVNRGNALSALRRADEALASYNKAIALRPDFADAYNNIGNIYSQRGSYRAALDAYDRALSLRADDSEARSMRLYAKLHLCDWRDFDAERAYLLSCIERDALVYPFVALAISSSLDEQLRCARVFSRIRFPSAERPLWRGEPYSHDRIRVAYLSADFREHATANLLIGLFEQHDRSRFEITGLSFGPNKESAMARRIEGACERFVDVQADTDQEIAELMRQLEIDIAVDPMGYTQGARPGIFARRAAPVQVSYLGYLGTTGAEHIDYVLADPIVLPLDRQQYFSEKIVHLPDCFLTVDRRLEMAPAVPPRSALGLPAQGFVFCSLNNSYKFGRTSFELWMRLLRGVEGSVLWLLESNPDMALNLRREAERCGVDAGRIVFAPRIPLPAHLARQSLADLFLDTAPYNAGATAALALWAGAPVLTMMGETFVGRMAASMLRTLGLPELVTGSWAEYEATALKIATDPTLCASLKDRLRQSRGTSALFDTERFTRHVEAAYTAMWRAARDRRPAAPFAVKP